MNSHPINGNLARRRGAVQPYPERPPRIEESERPIGAIVGELWENTEVLVRSEISLARREFERTTEQAKHRITRVAAASAVLYTGFVAVIVATTLLLWQVMALWISTLLVGLMLCGLGYLLLPRGPKRATGPHSAAERSVHHDRA